MIGHSIWYLMMVWPAAVSQSSWSPAHFQPPSLRSWCGGGPVGARVVAGADSGLSTSDLSSLSSLHITPDQDLGTNMELGYQLDRGDWSDISLSKSSCGSLVSRFAVHKLLVWSTFWRGQNYSMGCPHCVFSPDNLLAAFSGIWLKRQNMLFVIATSTLI